MLGLVAAAVAGLVVTYLFLTKVVMKRFPGRGIVGVDVHKPNRPAIPEMGGTALLAGICAYVAVAALLGSLTNEATAVFLTVIASGAIGVADDLFKLDKRVKPALCALAGIPIVLLETHPSTLVLPLSVTFNIPTLYPLLVLIAIAVTTNATNMFDVMNGVASGTSLIVLASLVLAWFMKCFFVGGMDVTAIFGAALMMLPTLFVVFAYNKYPSKVFLGDTGTLAMGGAVGAFAIVFGLELPGVLMMMVPITNSFFSIFSYGGLFERSELRTRPILVGADGRLSSNPDPGAPLTLTRIMLLLGYEGEEEVFGGYMLLTLVMALIALASGFLAWGWSA